MTQPFKVAYTMSRFPKITETFVLYEMLAVARQGIEVELYPLLRERTEVMHPEAEALVAQAHFTRFVSVPILRSNLRLILTRPRLYFSVLFSALRATLGSRRFFLGVLAYFWKSVYLGELMAKHGIDHLHAHFASFPAATACIVHRLAAIPYSFTAHGSDLHRDRHMLTEKVRHAEFVIAISEYNRQVILDHCGSDYEHKIHLVHCGVDTRLFRPASDGEPKPERGGPLRILCTGTLHEVKGQTHLLDACALLRDRGIDFVVGFIGDGPDRKALERQAGDSGIADKTLFHGRLKRADVIAHLQRTDVVVLPSVPTRDGRREGIPVALMEAMAVGVPVISSRLSGIPELVDDEVNGILVPPGDDRGIADKLQLLAMDAGLRARLGAAGRRKIRDEFDLDSNAGLLASLFRGEGR